MILAVAMVFATSGLVNANSSVSAIDTINDPCQDLVFLVITTLSEFTDVSDKELAKMESEMLGNCYYSV